MKRKLSRRQCDKAWPLAGLDLWQFSAFASSLAVVVLPTPRAPENKISVMDSLVFDGVAQGARDWFLTGDFVKSLRPPLACDYLVGH